MHIYTRIYVCVETVANFGYLKLFEYILNQNFQLTKTKNRNPIRIGKVQKGFQYLNVSILKLG